MADVTSDNDATITSTSPRTSDSGVFRFLDLPRELRDAVYDLVYADDIALKPQRETQFGPDDYMEMKWRTSPLTSLLATCRQIKEEYREWLAASKQITLVLSDTPLFHRECPFLRFVKPAQAAQRCEIVMFNRCNKDCCVGQPTNSVGDYCIFLGEFERLMETVEWFVDTLPRPIPSSVRMGMWRDAVPTAWPNCTHIEQGMQECMDALTGVGRVSRVELFKYTAPMWSSTWDLSMWGVTGETDLNHLWATWTREDGWLGIPSQHDDAR